MFQHIGNAAALCALCAGAALAQQSDISVGMVLEPPNLDPTGGAAAAIDEVVYANVFEGLTRFGPDGAVLPALAESWEISEGGSVYTFTLHDGVTFHDGSALTAEDVVFTLDRARAEGSTNAQPALFSNIAEVQALDALTVQVTLDGPDGAFLFDMAWGDAVIVAPGTPAALEAATFRFIADPNAAFAALMAGDVDAFPNFPAPETLGQFEADPRFDVIVGSTEGETILAMNNAQPQLDDIRIRRAIAHAINRQDIIDGAMFGYGTPIGTHFAPHNPDYVDLTDMSAHDPEAARALLAEAAPEGLSLRLALPPPSYARRGGEIVAAQLREVGIETEITNMEWADWLERVFRGKAFDLTIVSHTEPMDINIYARPDYYFQYDNPAFRDLMATLSATTDPAARSDLYRQAQEIIAGDYVNGFLFQLAKTGVAHADLEGLWENSPTQANDLTAVRWTE
jgi:peptide/nickel transport system substrate-binding protein